MTLYLTRVSLLRLIGVMLLVLLPLFWHVPNWAVTVILAALVWRFMAAQRQWQLPHPALRSLLALAVFAGVVASHGLRNGQAFGTTLIAVMCALKLVEMRSRRDVMLTVFLMYFVLLTKFLLSQEMWTVTYLLACAVGITAFLIEVSHASVGTPQPLPLVRTLRMGGFMVACALPLMALLFVLFPRIPGPLWGLPADSGASRSGLSDSMSPGDIANLILSEEPAFRVQFFGEAPPMPARYWRGPVLTAFDGRTWSLANVFDINRAQAEYRGTALEYEVTLEPMRTRWLMALDLPDPRRVPADAYVNGNYQVVLHKPMRDRKLYRTASYLDFRLQGELPTQHRRRNLELPRQGNSAAQVLARQWRSEAGDDDARIVERALRYFREEAFYYTLQPPKLGDNPVDEFLFGTRRGFCEHYSSAFSYLMRSAGIPARVVTGYQGGTKNEFADFYTVRQSDAHAWSEVWLPQRGWVRIDPTAAVAPNRIESGIEQALEGAGEPLPGFMRRSNALWAAVTARWEWLDSQWNYWILAYGPELQQSFLSGFGLRDWSDMILALTILGMLVLAGIGVLMMRRYRQAETRDAALKLWQRAQALLARRGLVQRPHEGPRDFAQRVGEDEPALAPPMRRVLDAYLHARYLGDAGEAEIGALRTAIAQLR